MQKWIKVTIILIIFCLFIALFPTGLYLARRRQTYSVSGILFCGSKPATNILVKLIDDDLGPDPDDLMATNHTDSDGRFILAGFEREISNIDPRLKIFHDCNNSPKLCQREWKFELPDGYINGPTLDIGLLNLEIKLPGEERDCIH